MHPVLSERLVRMHLEEAQVHLGLFNSHTKLEDFAYPHFFVRFTNVHGMERLIRFECGDYDFQAVEVIPVDPCTREPLKADDWMLRHGYPFPAHPAHNQEPFLCLNGVRDYYTHPGHGPGSLENATWDRDRYTYRLPEILLFIRDRFADGSWT